MNGMKKKGLNGHRCGNCSNNDSRLSLCTVWGVLVNDDETCPDWSDGKVESETEKGETK